MQRCPPAILSYQRPQYGGPDGRIPLRYPRQSPWATTPLTRVQTLRGLVAGVVASLTGLSLFAEAGAKGKGKGKKTRRRRRRTRRSWFAPVRRRAARKQKVKDPSALINQNPRCNYGGGCTHQPLRRDRAAATGVSPRATGHHLCRRVRPAAQQLQSAGQRPRFAGRPVCPMAPALACAPWRWSGGGCTQSRTCATTSEGQSICIVIPSVCGTLQPCPVTTSCPQGSACIACGMAGLRCVQVGVCP